MMEKLVGKVVVLLGAGDAEEEKVKDATGVTGDDGRSGSGWRCSKQQRGWHGGIRLSEVLMDRGVLGKAK